MEPDGGLRALDHERWLLRRGPNGCLFVLGLPLGLAGALLLPEALREPEAAGLVLAVAVPMVVLGLVLCCGRERVVLHRGTSCLLQEWGPWGATLWRRRRPFAAFARVQLGSCRSVADSGETYPVDLVERGGRRFRLAAPGRFESARALAERVASLLALPLEAAPR